MMFDHMMMVKVFGDDAAAQAMFSLVAQGVQKRVVAEVIEKFDLNESLDPEVKKSIQQAILDRCKASLTDTHYGSGATVKAKLDEIARELMADPEMKQQLRVVVTEAIRAYTEKDLDQWVRNKVNEVLTTSIREHVHIEVAAALAANKAKPKRSKRRRRKA